MRYPIDLKRMSYIVEVARAKTITVAAETLGLTQPAVTRSIAEVEEALGARLFDRVPRGMRLTEAGTRFVAHAKRILGDVDDLVTEMRTGTDTVAGRLRLGIAPGSDAVFAIRSVRALAETHPGIALEIFTGSAEALCPRLLNGELHAVLGDSTSLQRWRDLQVTRLCRLHSACMVRKGHPITESARPTELDMLRYPLLMAASVEAARSPIALRYVKYGLHMQPRYRTDHPFLLRSLIKTTDAFHVLHHPDPSFKAIVSEFDVLPNLVVMPERYFSVAWSAAHPKTESCKRLEAQLECDFLSPGAKYVAAWQVSIAPMA